MSDKLWKAIERRAAKMIDGKRNPVGTGKPDVSSEWLVLEVKERKQLPKWIQDDLDKARKKATDEQLGIVLLHQKGKHDDVIILARSDWEAWFGFQKPIKEEVKDEKNTSN